MEQGRVEASPSCWLEPHSAQMRDGVLAVVLPVSAIV